MPSEDAGIRDPQTYAIIGVAMEVHRELGPGFLEAVYKEAMAIEFKARGIPFERETILTIFYKEHTLVTKYRADFICYGNIVVEVKAITQLLEAHRNQTINYLKATRMHRALLFNFGEVSLRYHRLVFGTPESHAQK